MSAEIGIKLVSKTADDALPGWTTFIFEIVGKKRDATALLSTLRSLLLTTCLMDSGQDGKQITLVVSDIKAARDLFSSGSISRNWPPSWPEPQ